MSNPGSEHTTVPVQVHQYNQSTTQQPAKSAAGSGIIALVLAGIAFLSAPIFLLIPYVGFIPALIAGAGIIVAWRGLRRATYGTGLAIAGLILSVTLFALLAGVATVWNFVVADPAIRDYDQLQEVIEYIKTLIFGS